MRRPSGWRCICTTRDAPQRRTRVTARRKASMQQEQFLDVINRDTAEQRFRAALDLRPLPAESVALSDALGRVLAADVPAPIDVPAFDRSNVDGFAVRAEDTFGAS